MECLLQSCQAQHQELAEERREHQKQFEWERKRHEERDRILQEERENEWKRLERLEEITRLEQE